MFKKIIPVMFCITAGIGIITEVFPVAVKLIEVGGFLVLSGLSFSMAVLTWDEESPPKGSEIIPLLLAYHTSVLVLLALGAGDLIHSWIIFIATMPLFVVYFLIKKKYKRTRSIKNKYSIDVSG